MLDRMESILGPVPQWMLLQGKNSGKYYTTSRYIYETSDDVEREEEEEEEEEEEAGDGMFILRPKKTSLRLRLRAPNTTLGHCFFDFMHRLLAIDPTLRMTAQQALEHPFLAA